MNKNNIIVAIIIGIILIALWIILGQGSGSEKEIKTKESAVSNNIQSNENKVSSKEKEGVVGLNNEKFGEGKKITMYKSPNCGCCVGYAEELEKRGFEVETVSTDDMANIKDKYKIPTNQQSCHTMVSGNYFIEGHVPLEAVEKLLNEEPKIDGIGLPRMPSGTPGMPGPKRGAYEVYQSTNGEFTNFLTI